MFEVLRDFEEIDFDNVKSLEFENMVYARLTKLGEVKRQVRVSDRGDGKTGRVDFVLRSGGKVIGIEVDRKTPRKKSVFKLYELGADNRFVFTRSPFRIFELE